MQLAQIPEPVRTGNVFRSGFGLFRGYNDLVSVILSYSIALAGIILFFLLLFGGFSIIIGAGNDDPQATARGKQAATAAVVGFLVVFSAFWMAKIIERITGTTFI